MKENKALRLCRILLIAAICLMCAIPFYVLLVLSLNAPSRVFYEGNIFVPTFTWSNYGDAWAKSRVGQAMINSGVITFGALGLTILLGGMAGYAIARRNDWMLAQAEYVVTYITHSWGGAARFGEKARRLGKRCIPLYSPPGPQSLPGQP